MLQATFRVAAAAVVGAFAFGATTAEASTCDILNFTTSTECISPVGGGPGGNVTASAMNNYGTDGAFGVTGWMELAKLDRSGSPGAGDTAFSSGDPYLFSITYENPLYKQGTWALNPLWNWGAGSFAFAIKGATDNAVYLMDLSFRDGLWFVNDLNNAGGNPDMSNIRLFGTAQLAPIPLPAAAWMLLAALGGLFVIGRRRKSAAA